MTGGPGGAQWCLAVLRIWSTNSQTKPPYLRVVAKIQQLAKLLQITAIVHVWQIRWHLKWQS